LLATTTQNAVLTIRINRPEKRNALTLAMREEFAALLLDADTRDDVSAVVVTGTDPAFCAGVDLGEFGSNIMTPHDRRYRVNPTRAIFSLRKPIVAAVNGACVSGGLEIALACDFIIASDRATFADSHASIGAMPSWGLTALLPRAVGVRMAKQMSLTGARFDARSALAYGLVNEVVAHDELEARIAIIAAAIVAADSHSVRQILDLYDRGDGASLPEALAFEVDAIADRVTEASKVQQRGSAYRSGAG
jgi:enoyl-CoA hydratase